MMMHNADTGKRSLSFSGGSVEKACVFRSIRTTAPVMKEVYYG